MRIICWMVVLAAVAACGGDDEVDLSLARSGIYVADNSAAGIGSASAYFFDRDSEGEPRPQPDDGDCIFFQATDCDPACDASQLCGYDGQCVDRPGLLSAGTLTLAGTSLGDVQLDQNADMMYSEDFGDLIIGESPHIDVSASGSEEVAPFQAGIDTPSGALAPDSDDVGWPTPVAGQDFELSWRDADPDSRVAVFLTDDAWSPWILCDGPDTGSFTISAELVDRFLAAATWSVDYETYSYIERYRTTGIELDDGNTIEIGASKGAYFSAAPAR